MSNGDTPISATAQAGNSNIKGNSNSASDTRHMKQEIKTAKSPARAKAKQEQALSSKSTLRPASRPQQPRTSSTSSTSNSKQEISLLPNDTPVKTRRLAQLESSDDSKSPGHEQQQKQQKEQEQEPQRNPDDDTSKPASPQQTLVTTDDAPALENPALIIQDLEQKIQQMHKVIKLAQRNTAKDQEAASRIARENEALGNELDMSYTSSSSLPKQTVEGLTAACAKARQKLQDTDQAIVKLHARLKQVYAEADVRAEQVDLAESSMLVDQSITETTRAKVTGTTTAATDDGEKDEDEDEDSNNNISESDDEDDDGIAIPLLPVYTPDTE
jgi:hypothetical protein